eukprot:Selendium_serpulae@DN3908_c0_g1_i1.p1
MTTNAKLGSSLAAAVRRSFGAVGSQRSVSSGAAIAPLSPITALHRTSGGLTRGSTRGSTRSGFSTLVLSEHDNAALSRGTLSVVTAAKCFDDQIELLVAGHGCSSVADEASKIKGVSKVIYVDHQCLKNPLTPTTNLIEDLNKKNKFSVIMGPTNTGTREVLCRLGAVMDVQPLSDIIKIEAADTFLRPTYAGNAITRIKSLDKSKILLIRPTAFEAAERCGDAAAIEKVDASEAVTSYDKQKWIADQIAISEKPQLANADVVVSGGRALQNAENFKTYLEPLCDLLKAALGATRAAVDAGMVPNELQVGQTGKVVAPKLYLAVGISGAIQHVAGMKDSKVIVAINKDGDAPIFKVADYGLVGDYKTLIPELTEGIKKRKLTLAS